MKPRKTKWGAYDYYALQYRAPNPDDSVEIRLISSYPCTSGRSRYFQGVMIEHPEYFFADAYRDQEEKINVFIDLVVCKFDTHVYGDD